VVDIFMPANARLDDAHGWKHRKRFFVPCLPGGVRGVGSACCWVLREQAPPSLGGGFCCLKCRVRIPVLIPVPDRVPVSLRGGWVVGGAGGSLCGVCGLVGVCELDSGCEHLVVMFCGLFVVCVK